MSNEPLARAHGSRAVIGLDTNCLWARTAVADIVEGLLTAPQLAIEKADVIWCALRAFRGSNTDFSDAVIVELGRMPDALRRSPLTVTPPLIRDSR